MKSLNIMIVVSTSPEIKIKETCFMMKFIKMKYHDREAYVLYHSVLFVIIVVFVVFSELKSEKHSRIARVCTFLCPKFFTSAGET